MTTQATPFSLQQIGTGTARFPSGVAIPTITDAAVDPWGGNQDMLQCAAKTLQTLQLPPPAKGHGEVLLRLDFNPRSGLH